jgi:retron-type reverse transcriptase
VPKTKNGLWLEITDWDRLLESHRRARLGKRYRTEVLEFDNRLEENLTNIQNHLIWKTWQPGPWRQFTVTDPKLRLIQAPPFPDRVVHHALVDTVEPYFENKMIKDSYACRKEKGTQATIARLQYMLRRASNEYRKVFALQADISKYFPSINHARLLEILARTIKDKNTLWLCERVVRDSGYNSRGIPVGALTSQLFANVYMDQLDHKIKDDWGVKNYLRYMDDFVILADSKKYLWELYFQIEQFLAINLNLSLNPKTTIFPAAKGIDFAGYRTWTTHILPRKRNIKRAKKKFESLSKKYANGLVTLDYIKPRVSSFLGYTKHCNANKTTQSTLNRLILRRK